MGGKGNGLAVEMGWLVEDKGASVQSGQEARGPDDYLKSGRDDSNLLSR